VHYGVSLHGSTRRGLLDVDRLDIHGGPTLVERRQSCFSALLVLLGSPPLTPFAPNALPSTMMGRPPRIALIRRRCGASGAACTDFLRGDSLPSVQGIRMKRRDHLDTKGYTSPIKVMTVREVAAYLRVAPVTIYRLLRNNQLPAFRLGSDWRFNTEEIQRWLTQQERRGN